MAVHAGRRRVPSSWACSACRARDAESRALGGRHVALDHRAQVKDADGDPPGTAGAARTTRTIASRATHRMQLGGAADVAPSTSGLAVLTCPSGTAGASGGRAQDAIGQAHGAVDAGQCDARSSASAALATRTSAASGATPTATEAWLRHAALSVERIGGPRATLPRASRSTIAAGGWHPPAR